MAKCNVRENPPATLLDARVDLRRRRLGEVIENVECINGVREDEVDA